jgi:hypothetical protein
VLQDPSAAKSVRALAARLAANLTIAARSAGRAWPPEENVRR